MPTPTLISLETTAEVIEALGGKAGVRAITGAESSQTVWNWNQRGRFPANMHAVMTEALAERGFSAPSSLWGQITPPAESVPEPARAEAR